jgi:hypothetical protein
MQQAIFILCHRGHRGHREKNLIKKICALWISKIISDLKIVRHPEQSEGSSTCKQEIPRFARNDIFIVGGEHLS